MGAGDMSVFSVEALHSLYIQRGSLGQATEKEPALILGAGRSHWRGVSSGRSWSDL